MVQILILEISSSYDALGAVQYNPAGLMEQLEVQLSQEQFDLQSTTQSNWFSF